MSKHHSIQRESFLSFTPSLACHIGVEAAIVVQKIAWLCGCPNSGKVIDGERWVWNTHSDWQMNFFPFWSVRTIRRILEHLEDIGVLVSCQPAGTDRTKYYRVSEGMYENLTIEALDSPSGQNGQLERDKLDTCLMAESSTELGSNGTRAHRTVKHSGFSDRNRRPVPNSEEEMMETLKTENVDPDPGDDLDGGFYDQMVKSGWCVQGKAVADWVALYRGRLKKVSESRSRR